MVICTFCALFTTDSRPYVGYGVLQLPPVKPEPMYQSKNPVSNTLTASYSMLTDQQVKASLSDMAASFTQWEETTLEQRLVVVEQIANGLRDQATACAAMITREMGKPIAQSQSEIEKCIALCHYYVKAAPQLLAPQRVEAGYVDSWIQFEPIGGVLGIMPWNFPFWQVFRYTIPALLSGNVVLLKPAPNVPGCAAQIQDIIDRSWSAFPIFKTLFISVPQVSLVVSHPLVQGVTLTGSDQAGAAVAALAGQHLKKCVMELGGSDPFIILEDADLEEALDTALRSRFNNSGQTCIAAKRLILHQSIYEEAMAILTHKVNLISVGDPMHTTTDIGPLARPDLLDQLAQQVALSVQQGATIRVDGGRLSDRAGNFFAPMVLENIPESAPAATEELFGPVLSVFVVADDRQAITLANNTTYGLGGAIWTQDMDRAKTLARQMRCGTIAINGMTKSDPHLPFGGIKRSGFGRELGAEGIREFTNIKTIVRHG